MEKNKHVRIGSILFYVCDACGQSFQSEESDEETMEEAKRLWGDIPEEKKARVCDPCFRRLMANFN